MRYPRTKGLYYITHINNVPSILKIGILSHERVEAEHVQFAPIYDAQIVTRRREIKTPDGRSLWSFANLYFQPRNAMLYRVIFYGKSTNKDDIAILAVRPDILDRPDIFISDGNAASSRSEILPASEGRKVLSQIRKATDKEYWSPIQGAPDDSKREMMAECLVPNMISPEFVQAIYVPSREAADKMKSMLQQSNASVIPEPRLFFQPSREIKLTQYLSVVEGDMFFSRLHTLTVSVNCVGVMGKGLASRAKYQFPDVYVLYQDLCRKRKLQLGKPYLYKRETPFDNQLADEPSTLSNAESETWFLLFATKHNWRERADIDGIEKGLQRLCDNYSSEGIKSLAIPALGCGLGRLEWRDVGPLLCKYLSTLDIPVQIYLPAESKIPDDLLSKDFLLG